MLFMMAPCVNYQLKLSFLSICQEVFRRFLGKFYHIINMLSFDEKFAYSRWLEATPVYAGLGISGYAKKNLVDNYIKNML